MKKRNNKQLNKFLRLFFSFLVVLGIFDKTINIYKFSQWDIGFFFCVSLCCHHINWLIERAEAFWLPPHMMAEVRNQYQWNRYCCCYCSASGRSFRIGHQGWCWYSCGKGGPASRQSTRQRRLERRCHLNCCRFLYPGRIATGNRPWWRPSIQPAT